MNQAGDVVYCEQNVQGGNLKHLIIDGTAAYNLLFQIEYVSDTEYSECKAVEQFRSSHRLFYMESDLEVSRLGELLPLRSV